MAAGPAERAFQEGSEHLAAGRVPQAVEAYRRSVAADPGNAAIHFNLAVALRRQGELRASALALRRAERLAPRHQMIMTTLVDVVAEWANAGAAPAFEPPPATGASDTPLSVIACSIDARKEAAMRAHYAAALAGREHELVVIHDARSLAEGYTRGMEQSRHPLVVFSHDDVELVSPDPFGQLAQALQSCEVVGLAGSTRVSGPAVSWAGHPHLHGLIAYPAPEGGFDVTAYSLEAGLVAPAQGLDGLLFAARREAVAQVGFDSARFDGFHFYDLDFTYRAHRVGLRVAITTDVVAVHQSKGSFDEAWHRYRERFQAKHPELRGPQGPNFVPAARVRDRTALLGFYGGLRAIANA
jgi:hypothetical protein